MSQFVVCSMQPKPSARGPPGQGPGSSVDAGASIRLGVHSHCTRVRYTHGGVHSHRTHVRYTHPNVISMCISGLCPMAVYLDVYIGPVSDARVPPSHCTCGSYTHPPPQVDMLSDWLSYKSGPRSHAHLGNYLEDGGVFVGNIPWKQSEVASTRP